MVTVQPYDRDRRTHSSLRAERGQALLALSLSLPPSSLISTMLPSPPCTMYRVCY
ncbi:MAG: hypothetical protein ACK56F_32745 [bacterium]